MFPQNSVAGRIFQAIPQIPSLQSTVHQVVGGALRGLDRFVARPEIEPRVANAVYELAQKTDPSRLLTTFPERSIGRFLQAIGRPANDTNGPLSRSQQAEYLARHAFLSVVIAPLVLGFFYQANPETTPLVPPEQRRRIFDLYTELVTRDAAKSWDVQTELLFMGLYGAMQRAALPATLEAIRTAQRKSPRERPIVMEIGAGTGVFADALLETLRWTGRTGSIRYDFVELSPANLEVARRHLGRWGRVVDFQGANRAIAEDLRETSDRSVDVVVSINLFHELPPHIRRKAVAEMARVLKPGGRVVFFDSVQREDGVDSLLDLFGGNAHRVASRKHIFHEPFYPDYAREDLRKLFGEAGLQSIGPVTYAYLAKGMVFERHG